MTPAKNKKKKQLDVSSQSDNSPSAQLMSYILEEKRNEKQQQLSSQPLHHQVHPVDAFLSGISHTLKTLNPLQLNEARTRIFAIVQEIERSQLLESQSRAMMVHHEVPPLPICQASFSGSTYPPRIPGSHPRVPTHPSSTNKYIKHHLQVPPILLVLPILPHRCHPLTTITFFRRLLLHPHRTPPIQ